jgi:hypothetical protein
MSLEPRKGIDGEIREIPNPDNPNWTAFEFVWWFGVFPMSIEKPPDKGTPASWPSKSEIRRWLDQQSVIINGKKPKSKDIVQLPVTQLVFFPKSDKKRATVI